MTSIDDARRGLKIDGGIFLRTVLVMSAITWPLMLSLRLMAGTPLRTALINMLSLSLLFYAAVFLGVRLRKWLALTPGLRRPRRWSAVVVYGVLLLICIYAQIRFTTTQDYLDRQPNQRPLWVGLVASRVLGVGLGVYYYFHLSQRKHEAAVQARIFALEQMGREAEIERLRAQINPHFLFNTLTSIAGTTTEPHVEEMAQRLADVSRYNLSHAGESARFEEEVQAIESYLQLERMRFGERLQYELEVSRVAREAMVSQPVLLPLVENAIKHGFITSPRALRLKIEVSVVGAEFRAVVENSGRWTEPRVPAAPGTQIGLNNLKRRLALIYGERARVERVALPEAVRFIITLPVEPVA